MDRQKQWLQPLPLSPLPDVALLPIAQNLGRLLLSPGRLHNRRHFLFSAASPPNSPREWNLKYLWAADTRHWSLDAFREADSPLPIILVPLPKGPMARSVYSNCMNRDRSIANQLDSSVWGCLF